MLFMAGASRAGPREPWADVPPFGGSNHKQSDLDPGYVYHTRYNHAIHQLQLVS